MTQRHLNRTVASATGESVRVIQHRGFGLVPSTDVDFDLDSYDAPPQVVDWDAVERERHARFPATQ